MTLRSTAGVTCSGPRRGKRRDYINVGRIEVYGNHKAARELAARPYGRVIAYLVARAQVDEDFAREYREQFVGRRRARGRVTFERAIERGEIAASTDVETALDLLYGPFYHRVLHGHAAVSEGFARTVLDYVLAAVGAPPSR